MSGISHLLGAIFIYFCELYFHIFYPFLIGLSF